MTNFKTNFKEETLDELKKHNKTKEDILFICVEDYKITWDNFISISDFDYHFGYGKVEVEHTLKIVGKNFVMIRAEYDGSEWWEYIDLEEPKEFKKVKSLKYEF